jgi:hypothetical protein
MHGAVANAMTHEHATHDHFAAVSPRPPHPHPKPNPNPTDYSRAQFSAGTARGFGLCVNFRFGDPDYCGRAHKQPVDERTGMPIG